MKNLSYFGRSRICTTDLTFILRNTRRLAIVSIINFVSDDNLAVEDPHIRRSALKHLRTGFRTLLEQI